MAEQNEDKIHLTRGGKAIVALLAIYLLFLLVLSLSWFGGLMFADTNAPENADLSLAKCIVAKRANSNTNAEAANTRTGNTNSTTSNINTNAATVVTNSNAVANANRTASPAPAGGSATPTPKPAVTPTPTPTPTPPNKADKGEEEAFNLRITRVVTVDNDSFIGSLFSVKSFTQYGCITADGYLFLIVLFAGMIGAIVRALIYLCWRAGTEKFSITWSWYYLFQPFIGAAMAIVVYVVIRGGFNGGAIGKGNIYAFAAVAFLTALFSDNAMAKLKLIAESLLVKGDPRPKTDDKKKDGSYPAGGQADEMPPSPERPSPTDGGTSDGGRTSGSMAADEPPV